MKTIVGLLTLISTPLSLSAAKSGGERSRSEISPEQPNFSEIRQEQRHLIEIRKDRRLMFEGKLVTEDHLIRRIRGKVAQDRNVKLHIQGDAGNQQQVVDVIDLCQRCGAWNISFASARRGE